MPASSSMDKAVKSEPTAHEARFASLMEMLPVGVLVAAENGAPLYRNPAALKLQELAAGALPPADFGWKENAGKALTFEFKSGAAACVVEMAVQTAVWEDRPVFLAVLRDVTHIHEREVNLQKAVDDAELRAGELEVMRFVADQLNQASMLDETIQSGLEMIQVLTGALAVWAVLLNDTDSPRVVALDPQLKSDHQRTALELGTTCACLTRFKAGELTGPTWVSGCDWVDQIFPNMTLPSTHLSLPLRVEDKAIGVLNLAYAPERMPQPADLEVLETVSRQLAVAVDRGEDFSQTRTALMRDEGLNRVTRTISSALDLPTVLQNVLSIAMEILGADAGALGLVQDHIISFPFIQGLPPAIQQLSLPRADNLLWKGLDGCAPLLVENMSGQTLGLPEEIESPMYEVLLAPIHGRDECLGVIMLISTNPHKKMNKFDISMAESLGRQAGIAIQNAQLYFEVQQLTTSDTLTGLNNRLSFTNLALKEVERAWRYGRPLSMLVVDIDGLEAVNRKYGHDSGDLALKTTARALSQGLRRVDVLGRYEADEFVLLLPETPLETACMVADRLRARVAEMPVEDQTGKFKITVSIGVTGIEGRMEVDLQSLLDQAEGAMFEAKDVGGNAVKAWAESQA